MMRALSFLIIVSWAVFAIACGGDDSKGGGGGTAGGGGTGGVLAQQCSNRCANRAAQCGSPASETANLCNPLCAQQPTEDELHCIATTDCTELIQAFGAHQTKCGLKLGSATGGSGGTSGGDAG